MSPLMKLLEITPIQLRDMAAQDTNLRAVYPQTGDEMTQAHLRILISRYFLMVLPAKEFIMTMLRI